VRDGRRRSSVEAAGGAGFVGKQRLNLLLVCAVINEADQVIQPGTPSIIECVVQAHRSRSTRPTKRSSTEHSLVDDELSDGHEPEFTCVQQVDAMSAKRRLPGPSSPPSASCGPASPSLKRPSSSGPDSDSDGSGRLTLTAQPAIVAGAWPGDCLMWRPASCGPHHGRISSRPVGGATGPTGRPDGAGRRPPRGRPQRGRRGTRVDGTGRLRRADDAVRRPAQGAGGAALQRCERFPCHQG